MSKQTTMKDLLGLTDEEMAEEGITIETVPNREYDERQYEKLDKKIRQFEIARANSILDSMSRIVR